MAAAAASPSTSEVPPPAPPESGQDATAAAAAAAAAGPVVRFAPLRSTAEPSLWMSLGDLKLNVLRLDEAGTPVDVSAGMGIDPLPTQRGRGEGGATATGSGGATEGGAAAAAVRGARIRLDGESLAKISTATSISNPAHDDDHRRRLPSSWPRNETVRLPGRIVCLNTVESFRQTDKNGWLDRMALPGILRACGVAHGGEGEGEGEGEEGTANSVEEDGGADDIEEEDTSPLTSLVCLTHLDLKRHVSLYWFGFPALLPRTGRAVRYSGPAGQASLADSWGGDGAVQDLTRGYHDMRIAELLRRRAGGGGGCDPFFLVVRGGDVDDAAGGGAGKVRCLPLNVRNYESLSDEERKSRTAFGFLDPTSGGTGGSDGSSDDATALPVGWTLRNLVAYLTLRLGLGGTDVDVVSFRPAVLRRIDISAAVTAAAAAAAAASNVDGSEEKDAVAPPSPDGDSSLLLRIALPAREDYDWSKEEEQHPRYRCTGWELNARSRPGPRSVNLAPLLSPSHLASQASDLNLRLMKWRMVPDLDLDKLGSLNVLLLGAGTLGCSVARTLLGWGVRNLTFVDNGRVSYSNPVRQNLFELTDCADSGRPKAVAAAEALRRIAGADNVNSDGVVLTIPMPGHPLAGTEEEAKARDDVAALGKLVRESDVVFLLTDTRESRWLPTVMARAEGKMMINAALGLDSWLVMRHGGGGGRGSGGGDKSSTVAATAAAAAAKPDTDRLGCYFCNDIVAPENSTHNRTLDQQCTVTRPGLAPIASSMAVELCVSLLHHPDGQAAPAPPSLTAGGNAGYRPTAEGMGDAASPLGLMPHQIRGSVVSYTMMTPTVPAFRCCTGCSDAVVERYREDGFGLVKDVCCCLDGSFLEGVSGLEEFRSEADAKMEECLDDWDDEDEGM